MHNWRWTLWVMAALVLLPLVGGCRQAPDGGSELTTKYEYYDTGDDAAGAVQGLQWSGQTFTPSIAHTITSVKLLVYRSGLPHLGTVSIRATDPSTGRPTGGDLCSGTTDGDTLTTDTAGEWREITLGSGTPLAAGTKYAIVFRVLDPAWLASIYWRVDETSPTYAGGEAVYSGNAGSTWSSISGTDYMFEEWGIIVFERSLTVTAGLSPTLNANAGYARSLSATTGLSATLSRQAAYGRTLVA